MMRNERFLRACRRQEVDRPPVWMMRQAGRYLPEYRAIRSGTDFLTLCKTPELAAQVSLQPWEILGVDAVIMFSDILIPVEAMGMHLELTEKGPVLDNPVRCGDDVRRLAGFDPLEATPFVFKTIQLIRQQLHNEAPVIGFAGAPFTLASYMIEGGTTRTFAQIKGMMNREPALLHALLEKISDTIIPYLNAQIEAGVHAVQLFDTWAGELSPDDYEEFALAYERRVLEGLHLGPEGLATPAILYINGCSSILERMATSGASVLSVDWRVDLEEVRRRIGGHLAVQGNLDPCALLGTIENIRESVEEMLLKGGGLGHIANLGHGILPMTPVENAQAFVDAVKSTVGEAA
jgi:uroporphyrinogen decarboxylase